MKPVPFKFQNFVYKKNSSKYDELPAWKNKGARGEVVSCWKMSFLERLKVLFTGRVWLLAVTHNKPLTPYKMTTNYKELVQVNFKKKSFWPWKK